MYEPPADETTIALPLGENATLVPPLAGMVAGSENFDPKPDAVQGYAVTPGLFVCATAIAEPAGWNATPFPLPAGKVDGSAYFVSKPKSLHGYAVT